MTTVTRCNRCKEDIDKRFDYMIVRYDDMDEFALLVTGKLDLCANCKRSFREWLRNEPTGGKND